MNIYVASSWRNDHQQKVVKILSDMGHWVYDFKHPEGPESKGFGWHEIRATHPDYKDWNFEQYQTALNDPAAERGFQRDFEAMKNADCCVLVLPSGRSAHTEAGWMKGVGKQVYVFSPEREDPELMYKIYDAIIPNYRALESIFRNKFLTGIE